MRRSAVISYGMSSLRCRGTHKVRQMHVPFRVQQHIVRLDISVDDALLVYVSQGASELGNPKSDRLFCESLPRDMESKIASVH